MNYAKRSKQNKLFYNFRVGSIVHRDSNHIYTWQAICKTYKFRFNEIKMAEDKVTCDACKTLIREECRQNQK